MTSPPGEEGRSSGGTPVEVLEGSVGSEGSRASDGSTGLTEDGARADPSPGSVPAEPEVELSASSGQSRKLLGSSLGR